MKTSIILEGIDGVGKSTLANQLSQHYDIPVITIGGPPESDAETLSMSRAQVRMCVSTPVIFDRVTSISRVCYEENLCAAHRTTMMTQMTILSHLCTVVWLDTQTPELINKSYKSEQHMMRVIRDRQIIRDNYTYYMENVIHKPIKHDWKKRALLDLIREISNATR